MRSKPLHHLFRPVLERSESSRPLLQPTGSLMLQGVRVLHQYRKPLVLMAGVTLLLLLASPTQSLMAFDEGIYAQQARWMNLQADWVTVGWWGQPQFDRPIGFSWVLALSMHWFGQGEWAVRLPSMVASWIGVLLTWRLGTRLSPTGALWGAAILAVLPLWMQASRLGTPAVLLTTLGLALIWALLRAEASLSHRMAWGFLAGMLFSSSVLVGGTMVVVSLLALAPYLVQSHRRQGYLRNPGLYWGLGLGMVPIMLWIAIATGRYGWVTVRPWLQLPFGPFADTLGPSLALPLLGQTTIFYHLWQLPLATFPWSILALVGAGLLVRNTLVQPKSLWLGYPLMYVGLLSLIHQPNGFQALPVYPFLALWAGVGLDHLARLFCSPRPKHYQVAMGFGWALGVLAVLFISAGGALIITPGGLISPDIKLYGWLGLAVGLGWLWPWLLTMNRRAFTQAGKVNPLGCTLWQLGWLAGPGLAISVLFLTGLWGDYNPGFKTALQSPPIAPVLNSHGVHFIQPRQEREDILLSVYTPHLGTRHSNWQDIPSGEYAWGNSRLLPLPNGAYRIVGEVEGWQLVQAP
jgi:4-amino-4-deoxy-L-arabinose transferase-like glycosyltransferase